MSKVTGIGGVLFKAGDKSATLDWFRTYFGLAMEDWGTVFRWRERDEPETGMCADPSRHRVESGAEAAQLQKKSWGV